MELGGSGGELLGAGPAFDPDATPPYQVTVHARGESYSHSACKDSMPFVVRRGFVSIDLPTPIPHLDNLTVDGMNEDGLTISGHTLRQSLYQDESRSTTVDMTGVKLCYLSLAPWALATFRTVSELTGALRNVSVV